MTAPTDHLYTWTFSRKSLIIRYYLWLYNPDDYSVTFCKLFWGIVCSPLTLPIQLFIMFVAGIYKSTVAVAHGVNWVATETPPAKRMQQARALAKNRKYEARQLERHAKFLRDSQYLEELQLGYDILYLSYGGAMQGPRPPKPKKPSTPSKVADGVGSGADHIAAWMQIPAVDRAMSLIGKFFVRCVFYPIMIAVPLAAVGFVAWVMAAHVDGLSSGFHTTWAVPTHAVGGAAVASWQDVLIVLGISAFLSVIMYFGLIVVDKHLETGYSKEPQVIPGRVAQVVVVPFKATGRVTKRGFCKVGRGFASTGKFFVIGHHTVKYRTCPRIKIMP